MYRSIDRSIHLFQTEDVESDVNRWAEKAAVSDAGAAVGASATALG